MNKKHLEEKLSRKKETRGLGLTTNHRFIALMLRWGKRSRSHNILLSALYHCKQIFEPYLQGEGKDTIKVVDCEKNSKTQNLSINSTPKRRVRDLTISPDMISSASKRMNIQRLDDHVNVYRGRWNRLVNNLLVFTQYPKSTAGPLINKITIKKKAHSIAQRELGRAEGIVYSTDLSALHTPLPTKQSLAASQSGDIFSQLIEYTSLSRDKQVAAKQFCVNKRLISRRVGSQEPAPFKPLKQSVTAEKTEKEGLNPPSFATDYSLLNFTPIVSVQASKKQERLQVPLSVLQKKRENNVMLYRGVLGLKRLTIGNNSVSRVGPNVETRKVRIGGATYAVPSIPHKSRQEGNGIRWLLACAFIKKKRSNHPTEFCLANELVDSMRNQGESLKKRDQSHQTAAANRAYTRYRWW